MNSIQRIITVLNSGILMPELLVVPGRGATPDEIQAEELLIGRDLTREHVELLNQWNGIGLEVLTFYGCGVDSAAVGRLAASQHDITTKIEGGVVVGADPSGFIYLQRAGGEIFSFDTDGGVLHAIAADLNDLVTRVVFGADAESFGGGEWIAELRRVGIVS